MECANCSQPNPKQEYDCGRIKEHIVLLKVGDQFKYRHDLYSRGETESGPAFVLRKGQRVTLLQPDSTILCGDAYAYWLHETGARRVFLCSRRCAVEFAKNNNCLLCHSAHGAFIYPGQNQFDEYAREHNLTHCLTLMDQDEWKTPELEFHGLMRARLPSPERLLSLACLLTDAGKLKLAEEAVDKVVSEYPLEVSAQMCRSVLSKLGRPDRIDDLYEKLARSLKGRRNLPAPVLSSWAFAIHVHDPVKSLHISTLAVTSDDPTGLVIANHLAILSYCDPQQAVAFYGAHSTSINCDVGFYAAGTAYLRLGHLPEAEENLILSDSLLPDPMTKVYLAETLYRLGRFGDALQTCSTGLALLDSFEINAMCDFDGKTRNPSHYPYQQKKGLRKAFLAVEGKCLIVLGETESGKERIQDSLDVNMPFESRDQIYDNIRALIDNYPTRVELETDLAASHQVAAQAILQSKNSEKVIERLGDVISAIGQAQEDWVESLEQIKDDAAKEFVSEHFATKIHAFCFRLKSSQIDKYLEFKKAVGTRFPALPARVIEQLSNAEFLLATHKDGLPIFAGVIIEYCKALETALNTTMIARFATALSGQSAGPVVEIQVDMANGKSRRIELAYRNQPKHLMLGDLALLLRCDAPAWVNYCRDFFGTLSPWVQTELPRIVQNLKNDYRNGSAHCNSADRTKASQLKRYLESGEVFGRLDAISTLCRVGLE